VNDAKRLAHRCYELIAELAASIRAKAMYSGPVTVLSCDNKILEILGHG